MPSVGNKHKEPNFDWCWPTNVLRCLNERNTCITKMSMPSCVWQGPGFVISFYRRTHLFASYLHVYDKPWTCSSHYVLILNLKFLVKIYVLYLISEVFQRFKKKWNIETWSTQGCRVPRFYIYKFTFCVIFWKYMFYK